jgi:hypothetical protein
LRIENNYGVDAALSHVGRGYEENNRLGISTFLGPRVHLDLTGQTPTMDSVSPLRPLSRTHLLVLLIVCAISIGYMATHLKRGWVPHDEGTLGLSAERVLNGELPHRDFDDYTGGLTFVHALAFRELGISSGSMRIVLFMFFVLWVPAVFYVASRFCSAYSAGAVTLLAVAWSVPNYPGPMPSWYNLFFATFGAAALLRYVEAGTPRWVFLAGSCAGLSFLAKITASYFVAGVLLFFIFREQSLTVEKNHQLSLRARFYSATLGLGLTLFLTLLFRMINKTSGISGLIFFLLPALGLVILLVSREFAGIPGQNSERLLTLARMCVPFGVGVAVPLVVFLVPYLLTGSVLDLLHGLLAAPARAMRFATFDPQNPFLMLAIIPVTLPVILAYECRGFGRAICGGIVALYGCTVLVLSSKSTLAYSLGWCSLASAIPASVLAGIALLWVARKHQKLEIMRQQQIFLILAVTALCSLVQFPFAAPVYFLYVAPLLILLGAMLFGSTAHPPRMALGALICFYLIFVNLRVTSFRLTLRGTPETHMERLTIPRAGGLRVESSDARLYERLVSVLQSHASGGFIYAAPDCPQVYFLSGFKSPTRHYFEFAEDPVDRTTQILHALDDLNVDVVAINEDSQFSGPMSSDLQVALERRYPNSEEVGAFRVRWKK